jgi:outer membrane protein assembly factor BamD (BamD/ComL family)
LAAVEGRARPGSDASRTALLGLLKEYPQSPLAPRALLALSTDSARRGRFQEAIEFVDRVRSEYHGDPELEAQSLLERGRLLEQQGRWSDALEAFKSLPVEHPISEAALQAPLEIVKHYARLQDDQATSAALASAEEHYRDFMKRYPPGAYTVSVRTKLASTLILEKRHDAAISVLVDMGESMSGSNPEGARFLIDAARVAYRDMDDATRAAEILERTGQLYPNSSLGRWASAEAVKLREGRPD